MNNTARNTAKAVHDPFRTVKIERKTNYGAVVFYPANANAETICQLTGKKTISIMDFEKIKSLGFTLIQIGSDAKEL